MGGGNVGDTCNIPLPSWVLSVGDSHDIFYEDAQGSKDPEYVSLFVDEEPLFDGRTPLQIYSDFMNAYAQAMVPFIKDGTIAEIEVGMGPAGELRYPAYRTPWTFCGIGEFQASGSYALANLKAAATAAGNADWGNGPPDNCGNYNSHLPFTVGFWSTNVDQNNYQSAYGKFFLQWYSVSSSPTQSACCRSLKPCSSRWASPSLARCPASTGGICRLSTLPNALRATTTPTTTTRTWKSPRPSPSTTRTSTSRAWR